MKRIFVVFAIALVLVVTLVAPMQAYDKDENPTHPHNQCQVPPVDRTEDSSELLDFELQDFYEILPEYPQHSLFHRIWSSENADSEGTVSINTDDCHESLSFPCRLCLQWEDGPVEPVCVKWFFTKCVHRGHCNF